jgi:hypothetical protein
VYPNRSYNIFVAFTFSYLVNWAIGKVCEIEGICIDRAFSCSLRIYVSKVVISVNILERGEFGVRGD